MTKTKQFITLILASLTSAIVAVGLFKAFDNDTPTSNTNVTSAFQTASYNESFVGGTPFDFTKAAELGLPAVVHIRSTVTRNQPSVQGPSDMFDFFFGNPRGMNPREQGPREGQGFGSGVVISSDGYIVTNNHVIDDATEIMVTFLDDTRIEATLVGTDPTTDIALLKVDQSNLSYLKFADSEQAKVGQWVAAIGNPAVGQDPFSLKSTVTAGIISALGRNIGIIAENLRIESFIQTDAVINKGNSGGALVDSNGNLIGINTAITTPTGVYAGYGFAVPSNLVKKVVSDLKEYGEVKRALLGIEYSDISNAKAIDIDIDTKETKGLLINNVRKDGAADKAGLQAGDVIIEVDGENVTKNSSKLQEIIGQKRPDDKVTITYKRNGKTKQTTATLQSVEETSQNIQLVADLGAEFEALPESRLKELDIKAGVAVRSIRRDGLLYRSSYGDIKPGFIITNVNEKAVSSAKDVEAILSSAKDGLIRIQGFNEDNPNNIYSFTFMIR